MRQLLAAAAAFAVSSAAGMPHAATSTSIGAPNHGKLEHAAVIHAGADVHVVDAYAQDDAVYGTNDLVFLLEHAAHHVSQSAKPASPLGIGDLSSRGGGPLARHASHQSGRDADVGFYIRGPKGVVLPSRFLAITLNGAVAADPKLRFDDARNWALIEGLLETKVRVTHIFVAPFIRQRLLAYAAKVGVAPDLRTRAAAVMMQPSDAPLHDDHFHVRIGCPATSPGCIEVAMPKSPKS